MSNNLTKASTEWMSRPADERYWTVDDAQIAAFAHNNASRQVTLSSMNQLHIELQAETPVLVGPEGKHAHFTNFAFGQLCQRLSAPAQYLRSLPGELVKQNLNHALSNAELKDVQMLMQIDSDRDTTVRAITSDSYSRVWNYEVLSKLRALAAQGWKIPPARLPANWQGETRIATPADCLATRHSSLGINPGDQIAPSGVYVSDRDMFVFMVDDHKTIQAGHSLPLARGFFVENSEVGDRSLRVTLFLYDSACGNHIVWNVFDIKEVKLIHRGAAQARFNQSFYGSIAEYANASAYNAESAIKRSQNVKLGNTKDEIIDLLFGKQLLPRETLNLAYDAAIDDAERFHQGNDPMTAWGFTQGITLLSQSTQYTAERVSMDRAAGKLLQMTF